MTLKQQVQWLTKHNWEIATEQTTAAAMVNINSHVTVTTLWLLLTVIFVGMSFSFGDLVGDFGNEVGTDDWSVNRRFFGSSGNLGSAGASW